MDYLDLIDKGETNYYEYLWKYNKNNGRGSCNR